MREQLDRAGVAARTGLAIKSIDTYRQRGVMPEPDGLMGRSPWWYASTIDRWDARRRKLSAAEPEPVAKPTSKRRAKATA